MSNHAEILCYPEQLPPVIIHQIWPFWISSDAELYGMQHDCAEGSLRQLDKSFEQDTRFLKAGLIRCLTPINMLPPCKIYRLQGCFYHPFQAALNRYSWSHYFPPCLSYSKNGCAHFQNIRHALRNTIMRGES